MKTTIIDQVLQLVTEQPGLTSPQIAKHLLTFTHSISGAISVLIRRKLIRKEIKLIKSSNKNMFGCNRFKLCTYYPIKEEETK